MVAIPTKRQEPESKAVAAWIRHTLQESSISQRDAARLIGLTAAAFRSRLSRGYIDVVMLIRIARITGKDDASLADIGLFGSS